LVYSAGLAEYVRPLEKEIIDALWSDGHRV
jgi:hypothetical protein